MADAKLGSAQLYILGMVNPEWPTREPDARAVRVLESLQRRGLTRQNYGRWYITAAGVAALESSTVPVGVSGTDHQPVSPKATDGAPR